VLPGVPLLSCRITSSDVAAGVACCRLTPFHESAAEARARCYQSDTTIAQWALIDRLLPDPAWLAGKGGRRQVHCRRAIVDAIFYVVDNGIKWRALPSDFPPWSTVYNYFAAWEAARPAGHGQGEDDPAAPHWLTPWALPSTSSYRGHVHPEPARGSPFAEETSSSNRAILDLPFESTCSAPN